MKFDTSKAPKEWSPIAAGRHMAQVCRAIYGLSSAGNKMISLEWQIVENSEDAGKRWRDWVLLERDSGINKLIRMCNAAEPAIVGNAQDPQGLDPESQNSVIEHLLGLVLAVTVKHEKESYTGRQGEEREGVRIRTSRIHPLSGEERDELEEIHGEDGPRLPSDALRNFNGEGLNVPFQIVAGRLQEADTFDDIPF